MGRREMLAKAVRRQQQKQQPPAIIVIPPYATGQEPLAVYALNRRKPTESELVAALVKAGYPEDKSKVAAVRILTGAHKQSHPQPDRIQRPADPEEE